MWNQVSPADVDTADHLLCNLWTDERRYNGAMKVQASLIRCNQHVWLL